MQNSCTFSESPRGAYRSSVDFSCENLRLKYVVAFSVAPTGGGSADGSVHDAVAEAVSIVRSSGLPHQTGPMFTTIEGDWDECMDVIKRATEAVTKRAPRVSLVVKADIRPGHDHGEIEGKVQRLNAAIDQMESGK